MKINRFFAVMLMLLWVLYLYTDEWEYRCTIQLLLSGIIGSVFLRLMISEPFAETEERCYKKFFCYLEDKQKYD